MRKREVWRGQRKLRQWKEWDTQMEKPELADKQWSGCKSCDGEEEMLILERGRQHARLNAKQQLSQTNTSCRTTDIVYKREEKKWMARNLNCLSVTNTSRNACSDLSFSFSFWLWPKLFVQLSNEDITSRPFNCYKKKEENVSFSISRSGTVTLESSP